MAMPVNRICGTGASGPQEPIACDWTKAPFCATVGVYIVPGGSASYFDLIQPGASGSNSRWFTDLTLKEWQTANGVTSYVNPVNLFASISTRSRERSRSNLFND